MLKIIEGSVVRVPAEGGRKSVLQDVIEIDTTNILFIVGGAFDGIDKIIKDRIKKKDCSSIGFGAKVESKTEDESTNILEEIAVEDVIKYGIIPELAGRLPIIATLKPLDKDALMQILTKPKNAIIKQYQKLFEIDGVKLEFSEEALNMITDKAILRKTGARGLRAIIEEVMLDVMYEMPFPKNKKKYVVTKDNIKFKREKVS